MRDDHIGAYAATCAYFLMVSFVPFIMIISAAAAGWGGNVSTLMDGIVAVVPSGLKEYVTTIIEEISSKTYAYMPISILILLWSAAKIFHALTNGLNVISRAEETRGWFYLRFRSMLYVVIFVGCVAAMVALTIFGDSINDWLRTSFPSFRYVMDFVYKIRSLFGYFGLILIFLFIYKLLPNCYYTLRSQLPGAISCSTIWMFFSYLMAQYYENTENFSNIYGSMTGVILAMMWMYFCCFFLLFGAELNRVIYEDPDDNIIVNAFDVMRDASVKRRQQIMEELDAHSDWKPIPEDDDADIGSRQPKDIYIPWEDENAG